MPTTAITDLGRIGLIKDRKPVELPPNAWTELSNVRCVDGSIRPFSGSRVIDTLSVDPRALARITYDGEDYLYYLGEGKVYYWKAGSSTEVTVDGSLSAFGTQELTPFGNVVIVNDGLNAPYYTSALGSASKMPYDSTDESDICYWADPDIGMSARLIRAYKNYLIALDIDDCDGRNRNRVWWSHPAVYGTVPITWDVSKAEYDAGFYDLKDTTGNIVDALSLRDAFIIYLDDAIYQLTYAGSSYIGDVSSVFNIRLVTDNIGLFDRRCVCDIGGAHFFVSDQEIYLFDGTTFKSIADEKVKRHFFSNCSRTYSGRVFVIYNERYNEVWLCYPESGEAWPNVALVWNIADNAWSKRSIDKAMSATSAPATDIPTSSAYSWTGTSYTTWSSAGSDTWGSAADSIDDSGEYLLIGSQDNDLIQYDVGTQDAGSDLVCYVQRTHLDIGDKEDWHMVKRIRPYAAGGDVQVRVGTHDNLTGSATWSDRQTFDPDTQYKLDFRETGRLHAIEFYWPAGGDSEVSGYEIDFEPAGRR